MQKIKEYLKIVSVPAVIASLCCLSPVILVLAGVATTSFATSLTDSLYGEYKWYFRLSGLLALIISFVFYLRRQKGICTVDEALKHRNEIINKFAIALIAGTLFYIIFLYGVVEYVGKWLGIWE